MHWVTDIDLPDDWAGDDWLVLRVQDDQGNWSVTSPFYFRSRDATAVPGREPHRKSAAAVVFQISNATRFIELRRQFFAHLLVTVDPGQQLKQVTLIRESEQVASFSPEQGQQIGPAGKLPVTEINGDYEKGWVWHPTPNAAYHLQADWPITESGWYSVRYTTREGKCESTDAVYFDSDSPTSQQISLVQLSGPDSELRLWGYSEEMSLEQISIPFEGDHWWYPQKTLSLISARFSGQNYEYRSGTPAELEAKFRRADEMPQAP